MLLDVGTFRHRVDYELDALVADLQQETLRSTPSEGVAWRNSLPALAGVLSHDALRPFHVQVTPRESIAVEYRLPSAAAWADAVLLGSDGDRSSVVIVELKDWDTSGDEPGPREGLVRHANRDVLHPSDQVRGYAEYCRRFHSTVQEDDARVAGCVFFTYSSDAEAYRQDPHSALVDDFPVFARSQVDLERGFPDFLAKRLVEPDADFAHRFSRGVYRQDRGLLRQVSAAIRDESRSPFVLLDAQRLGYQACLREVERVLKPAKVTAKPKKTSKSVVVVEGPPGSGKSVVAAHLWAELAADERIDGNVVLTTTSGSQKSNWRALFEDASGKRAARGIVVTANQYNPGLSPLWVKARREAGHDVAVETWRQNLADHRAESESLRTPDDLYAVSIVDEAHGLIDPTVPGKRGIPPSGWTMHAGPQAWHVIRASRVSIFLMDGAQSYRDNETSTREAIEEYAREFGVEDVRVVSLAGSQFRCAGSAEYLDWLDATLELDASGSQTLEWCASYGGPFEFEVVGTPFELEARLRDKCAEGHSARILASYARPWRTKSVAEPHPLPPHEQDFHIECDMDGGTRTWSRIWNHAPDQDYTLFVQGPPSSHIATDPLAEVGCPYVVRGFDFDYVGLLWMEDLVRRDGSWTFDLDYVHESAWKKTKSQARKQGPAGPAAEELLERLKRGYRILLSRAMRGVFVWCADPETREYLESCL